MRMRCPLRFAKFVGDKNEECQHDCAWLITDDFNTQVCAIALMPTAGRMDYYKLNAMKKEES